MTRKKETGVILVVAVVLFHHWTQPALAFESVRPSHFRRRRPQRKDFPLSLQPNVNNNAQEREHEHMGEILNTEKAKAIDAFISSLQAALVQRELVSLVLRGPSKTKKKIKLSAAPSSTESDEDERLLRGCIREVQGRLVQLKQKTVLQMTFKYHSATDVAKNWPLDDDTSQIRHAWWSLLHPLINNTGPALGETIVPVSEWGHQREILADPMLALNYGIQSATFTTHDQRWELDKVGSNKPQLKLSQLQPGKTSSPSAIASHDRVKQVPLETTDSFLQALGITDAQGKPKRAMASKLRQCQKFVEVVGQLVARCTAGVDDQRDISVLDMGCGRGYLTFSLHSYLSQEYRNRKVRSVGIDLRPKLVQEINAIARALGPGFADTLTFQTGSIESSMVRQSSHTISNDKSSSLDILIALHACDTATDDALWYGIDRQADILVVAPCCHKQIRPQLNTHMNSVQQIDNNHHPLTDILCHNVYRERHAEIATDAMRALLVELAGYHPPNVFEFIGGEHTSKNVMITAVRRQRKWSHAEEQLLRRRLRSLAALHGIRNQKLAQWLDIDLVEAENGHAEGTGPKMPSNNRKLSTGSMPPLA